MKFSKVAGVLGMWLSAIYKYGQIHREVRPMMAKVNQLRVKIDKIQNGKTLLGKVSFIYVIVDVIM